MVSGGCLYPAHQQMAGRQNVFKPEVCPLPLDVGGLWYDHTGRSAREEILPCGRGDYRCADPTFEGGLG